MGSKGGLFSPSKNSERKRRWEEMERKRIHYVFLFIVLMLVFSSCHPRHVSDIKPAMTKEEVVSLWGKTDLITYKTVDGKTLETWEYHFSNTDSICLVTFSQDRVVNTQCRRQPRPYYYTYPYYPYPYYYGGYYRHYYPYYYPYHYPYYHRPPPPPTSPVPPKPASPPPSPPPAPPSKAIDKMTLQVLFDFDKDTFTETDLKELQRAVAFVRKYPGSNIRLDGYTDSIGTDAYNIKLSERRATAVMNYLIKEAGVDRSKITAVGHGKADPVADNRTAEGRAKNRRVEVSILSD
jgi:outer membrane protein OmpA-like peptidoglycan-associated protein